MRYGGTAYHLGELKVALDPNNPNRILPDVSGAKRILDIGCGAGQSLLALGLSEYSYGMDVDFEAVKLGRQHAPNVGFAQAVGEALPYRSASFDFVFSRVALPYMHVESALEEMHRVLEPGGRVWLTLHDPSIPWDAWKRGNLKGKIYFSYVMVNGFLLDLTGKQFRFPNGMCESYQTASRMQQMMEAAGFKKVQVQRARHFIATATA
jgi:ubiquinone/menaquinone biosynthesis C-methylase UbiE